MARQYHAPRGTQDILPEDQPYWDLVRDAATELCGVFGYGRIETPIFEEASLFTRGVGQATDIVQKEMYVLEDRGGLELALRPEGTAPVCRAYLEHGMHNLPQPVRLCYWTPIFRYDRPQAGRYRQHHQFGAEAIGDGSPSVDAEIIELLWRLYESVGLSGLTLHLNSIGDANCRPKYLEVLRDYYRDKLDLVCEDCRARFDRNPLRLLRRFICTVRLLDVHGQNHRLLPPVCRPRHRPRHLHRQDSNRLHKGFVPYLYCQSPISLALQTIRLP